jgi:hypothetical protein
MFVISFIAHAKQTKRGDGDILVPRHCSDRHQDAAFGRWQGRAPYFVHQCQVAHHCLLVATLLTLCTTHILHTNKATSATI